MFQLLMGTEKIHNVNLHHNLLIFQSDAITLLVAKNAKINLYQIDSIAQYV